MDELKPCPFCGGRDLVSNEWELDAGYVDAIECNDCYAAAPESVWNNRVEIIE